MILEKQLFFFRFPHSGGTRVSSANLFFEWFRKKTLQHRVPIVIGLSTMRRESTREETAEIFSR